MTTIDVSYFEWLTSQIRIPNNNRTYDELFSRLHNTEFVWLVPNDDNRVADGVNLREEFLDGRRPELTLEGASVLEVVVALSRRVAFTAGGDPELWAWRLLKHLNLNKAADPLTEAKIARIDDTLYALIWRTYDPSGRGGFFPLKYPKKDQTKLEIWFQMNAWIIEREGL